MRAGGGPEGKMELFLILVCLIAPPTLSLSIKSKLNPRIVQTRYGEVQGVIRSFEYTKFLKPIDVYLGIPYATPPVGGNRFSPTRAPSPWEGVRLSDSVGPVCPQKLPDISNEQEALERMPKGRLEYLKRLLPHLRNQSEDCLYLNIYAPAMGMADSGRRHPVLLYIHGESYDWGSGNPYDGSVLASYTDQVIVTMNYRLGVLGFLNANVAPQTHARVANYGLMDQIAVLQWVKEHIALFGGNPDNVTLMGQGTGAACVHFLAISPTVVRGLFKRAILLSGSALSSWAVVEDPASYALKLAKAVNCSIPEDLLKDNELIVDCLRDRSLHELMQIDIQPPTFLSAFGPSVDGVVIKPEFQKDLLSYIVPEFQGFEPLPKKVEHGAPITSNNKYDLLFGVTTSEALWKFAERDVQLGFEGERRDRIIRTYVRNAYVYHLTEIFYTVVNEYTDWERTVQHPINTKDACVQALSDAQFVAPLVQTGDLFTLRHTKNSNNPHIAPMMETDKEPMPKTYFYVFDYQMKDGDYPQKMGSVHGEELPFVFGAPLVDGFGHFPRNYTKSEVALSESMVQYFANFVRTGNPNVNDHHGRNDTLLPASREKNRFRGLTWEQYSPVYQKYLEIGLRPKMKNHYRAHQLSVWLRLVPELHRAGMEDVDSRHNLFRGHSDPSLYDGSVRPDPLSRISEEFKRKNSTTEPPTTTDYSATTCVSYIQSTNLQNVHNASTDTLANIRRLFDGPERDDRDRVQSADPERSHLRGRLLSEGQDAAGGEEFAAATDVESTVRTARVHRAQATAAAALSFSRGWPGDRRRRERDAEKERYERPSERSQHASPTGPGDSHVASSASLSKATSATACHSSPSIRHTGHERTIPRSTKRIHTPDSAKSTATSSSKEPTREPAPAAKRHRVESRVPGGNERDASVMLGPPSEAGRPGCPDGVDPALSVPSARASAWEFGSKSTGSEARDSLGSRGVRPGRSVGG